MKSVYRKSWLYLNSPQRCVRVCGVMTPAIGVCSERGARTDAMFHWDSSCRGLWARDQARRNLPWEVSSSAKVSGTPTRDESLKVRVTIK